MRKFYVVSPNNIIDKDVEDAAAAAGCSEIVHGIPPMLVRNGVTGVYPFVYTEPDDPQIAIDVQAVKDYLAASVPTVTQTIAALKALARGRNAR